MRVIYLTWGETPRSFGVFGNQVINQFVQTCHFLKIHEAFFVSAVPIVHSGFIRENFHYFDELSRVKRLLNRIKFIWIPIYTSQNFVNSNKNTFNLMHNFSHLHLLKIIKKISPDIVHCRSYHAAWAAIKVRERYGLKYKIIFDGRDMWPEEVALKLGFDETSKHYLFLKSVEKFIIERSDYSVTVSKKMHEYYLGLGALHDRCIYLSADVKKLFKQKSSKALNERKHINFCYLGALSDATWHKTTELANLYAKLTLLFPGSRLTIITTSNQNLIHSIFSKLNLTGYSIRVTKSFEELREILSHQDFGLMSYFIPENELQRKLGDILLSIKAVEYFSAGLPMICNNYCGEISQIINEFNLGISYDPERINSISSDDLLPYLNVEARDRCHSFALDNFDSRVISGEYANLYCEAVGV